MKECAKFPNLQLFHSNLNLKLIFIRMKIFKIIYILFIFLISETIFAQHDQNMNKTGKSNETLISGLGNYHHKVTTNSKEAQKFFDQGLILSYGFNHEEAIRSFQKAAELDPEMAMAYWGIAFALGPNYNLPADNRQRKLAYNAMQKAIKLSENVSRKEKDYIRALARRYAKEVEKVDQTDLNEEFRKGMKELYLKYPDDVDAATLYAESMMVLKPWQLWNKDGTPAEGTDEIISVLESVLKKSPEHPGANHYYIHAVEASNDPGRALASAKILEHLIPAAGHLVHMPAHIYFRIGDYKGASDANLIAIKADEEYLKKYDPNGIYPVMYYNHNINFLSVSKMMEGKFSDAIKYANQIEANVKPMISQMQMLEAYYANPLMILISFGKWDEILKYQESDPSLKVYNALLHYSKAYAHTMKGNLNEAKNELVLFQKYKSEVTPEMVVGLNPASLIMDLSEKIINGKIAFAEGEKQKAIDLLTAAIQKEDSVNYNEPPDWYPSVRLSLGAVLYSNGDYSGAENVFRDELKKYPHNGRGLYGLILSLIALGKDVEVKTAEKEFESVWENADVNLNINDY